MNCAEGSCAQVNEVYLHAYPSLRSHLTKFIHVYLSMTYCTDTTALHLDVAGYFYVGNYGATNTPGKCQRNLLADQSLAFVLDEHPP
jgi:hypothetical protein